MMGDGTEEQNLGERGNPAARIKKNEVTAAFGQRSKNSFRVKSECETSTRIIGCWTAMTVRASWCQRSWW
jgi:hypothetical protein